MFGVLQGTLQGTHQGGLTRKQLRNCATLCGPARPAAGDTGLIDFVIKAIVRQLLVGYWIRRSKSPLLGQMVYYLKKATSRERALFHTMSQARGSTGSPQAGGTLPGPAPRRA